MDVPHMVRGNWLVNYAKVEGIQQALNGVTRRSKFDSKMNESTVELIAHYEDFKKEFQTFFPLLKDHASRFLVIA